MIRQDAFVPELSHIFDSSGVPVFVTTQGTIGCIFEIPILDLEAQDLECRHDALSRLLSAIADGTTIRVVQRAERGNTVEFKSFRSVAFEQLGFVSRKVWLSVERSAVDPISIKSLLLRIQGKGSELQVAIQKLQNELPRHELSELAARALSSDEISELFARPSDQVREIENAIDTGAWVHGTVRLYKPGSTQIDEEYLTALIDQLSLPFTISVSARKLSRGRTDFRLGSQLERTAYEKDPMAAEKEMAAHEALRATRLHGEPLFELEWICTLSRRDEASLRVDLEKVRSVLSSFGDIMIETAGAVPSYIAAQIGASQHFTFAERHAAVPFYLPIYAFGEAPLGTDSDMVGSRTLLLHRLDLSVHQFDVFSRKFLAYNTLICGRTGSGKSVFGNALSSALMQDPDVRMIKIDVGGSYTKECEIFGGVSIEFSLDKPSGVNPFRIFRHVAASKEALDTVTEFLSILICEAEEKSISKDLRTELEHVLTQYVTDLRERDAEQVHPTIDDFLASTPEFPRKRLLSRWARGGVFENALRESPSFNNDLDVRYRYFNFLNLQSASNKDYVEGVMAAVIAMVNLEMLRIGDRSKGQPGRRLVLFCDETKFFIDRFRFFYQLAAANFRKYGHGLVLMLQNIRDAEYAMPDGTTNRGLILNSPIRVFFQADTEAEYFESQFKFTEHQLRSVVTEPYRGKEYREAVLQDDTGTRIVRLYLTDQEFWRMTSTKEDTDKYNALRAAAPALSTEEAIRCLSTMHGR